LDYRAAIPVLLDWLPKITNRIVQETVVRVLSVPWAKPDAARPLIRLFIDLDDDPQPAPRWAIGNALEVVADDQVSDDLIDLAADRRYGTTRRMIVLAPRQDPESLRYRGSARLVQRRQRCRTGRPSPGRTAPTRNPHCHRTLHHPPPSLDPRRSTQSPHQNTQRSLNLLSAVHGTGPIPSTNWPQSPTRPGRPERSS
jgi:hypothetical protein